MIHKTAIIEPGAQLGRDVHVGAYAYVGPEVVLGDGCVLHHHASVEGFCTMGKNNEVFPFAMIGGKTQDLKYVGGKTGLKIGDNNVFREHTTVHCATKDGEFTVLGNNNYLLGNTHVAHDCQLGNHIIISLGAVLGGHVVIEDHAIIGGATGIHQFCHIGQYSFIGGLVKVVQDVLPYMLVDGTPAEAKSINTVGLQRAGFSEEEQSLLKKAFKLIYRSGLNRSQAMDAIRPLTDVNGRIADILLFVQDSSRGIH